MTPTGQKVLLLSPEYTPELSGGVGTYVQELAHGLCSIGCEVVVIACSHHRPGLLRAPNKTVHLITPTACENTAVKHYSIVEGILGFNDSIVKHARNVLLDWRPEVIHCQNWITFPAGYKLSHEFGVPLITSVQYISEPIERWWGQRPDPEIVKQEAILFRNAKCLITISSSMQSIIETTYGIPKDQIPVVHNGIDAGGFIRPRLTQEEAAKLRRTIVPLDEKIVLFCGRLNPQKGIAAFLDSARKVLAANRKVCFVIVGAPDSKDERSVQEKLAQDPVLRRHTKLLGKLPRKQLALLYQIADVAVVPSIYEPFGYAALEAMAAAVPVIASAAGGLTEIVQHDETGILVPVNRAEGIHTVDVEKLALSQLILLGDVGLARRLGESGRQRAVTEFNVSKWALTMKDVYWQAIRHE
jgi:glycosyltransferase involved in cell wall biosynthesis